MQYVFGGSQLFDAALQGTEGPATSPCCNSCGIVLNAAELQRMHAMGGRCGTCQRLYEQGNYCSVCNKVRAGVVCVQSASAKLSCLLRLCPQHCHTASQNCLKCCRAAVHAYLGRSLAIGSG